MNRTQDVEIGIVIPCYNEEEVIPRLLSELDRYAHGSDIPVYILFVDDGSSDATGHLLTQACQSDSNKALIRFSRNFGHQAAVSAGLQMVRGNMVAVLDADLQDPIDILPFMIKKWKEGFDVVYGVRQNRKENYVLRYSYAAFYRLLKWIANIDLPLDAGDFALMDRRVVDHINAMPEHNRFVRGLRGWVGFKQIGLPYNRQVRFAGEPKYTLNRLVKLAFDGLVSFSSAPLKLAIWLGSMVSLLGFLLIIWAVASAFFRTRTPPGWASLAILVLFFSGVQLFVLGIIGEYVGRIFEEVKKRPHFIESERIGWVEKNNQSMNITRTNDSRPL